MANARNVRSPLVPMVPSASEVEQARRQSEQEAQRTTGLKDEQFRRDAKYEFNQRFNVTAMPRGLPSLLTEKSGRKGIERDFILVGSGRPPERVQPLEAIAPALGDRFPERNYYLFSNDRLVYQDLPSEDRPSVEGCRLTARVNPKYALLDYLDQWADVQSSNEARLYVTEQMQEELRTSGFIGDVDWSDLSAGLAVISDIPSIVQAEVNQPGQPVRRYCPVVIAPEGVLYDAPDREEMDAYPDIEFATAEAGEQAPMYMRYTQLLPPSGEPTPMTAAGMITRAQLDNRVSDAEMQRAVFNANAGTLIRQWLEGEDTYLRFGLDVLNPMVYAFADTDGASGSDDFALTYNAAVVQAQSDEPACFTQYIEYHDQGSFADWFEAQKYMRGRWYERPQSPDLTYAVIRLLYAIYRLQRDAGGVLADVSEETVLVTSAPPDSEWRPPKPNDVEIGGLSRAVALNMQVFDQGYTLDFMKPADPNIKRPEPLEMWNDFRLQSSPYAFVLPSGDIEDLDEPTVTAFPPENTFGYIFEALNAWHQGNNPIRGRLPPNEINAPVPPALEGRVLGETWVSFRNMCNWTDLRLLVSGGFVGGDTRTGPITNLPFVRGAPLPARQHLSLPVGSWDAVPVLQLGQRAGVSMWEAPAKEQARMDNDTSRRRPPRPSQGDLISYPGAQGNESRVYDEEGLTASGKWQNMLMWLIWRRLTENRSSNVHLRYPEYPIGEDMFPVYFSLNEFGPADLYRLIQTAIGLLRSPEFGFPLFPDPERRLRVQVPDTALFPEGHRPNRLEDFLTPEEVSSVKGTLMLPNERERVEEAVYGPVREKREQAVIALRNNRFAARMDADAAASSASQAPSRGERIERLRRTRQAFSPMRSEDVSGPTVGRVFIPTAAPPRPGMSVTIDPRFYEGESTGTRRPLRSPPSATTEVSSSRPTTASLMEIDQDVIKQEGGDYEYARSAEPTAQALDQEQGDEDTDEEMGEEYKRDEQNEREEDYGQENYREQQEDYGEYGYTDQQNDEEQQDRQRYFNQDEEEQGQEQEQEEAPDQPFAEPVEPVEPQQQQQQQQEPQPPQPLPLPPSLPPLLTRRAPFGIM